MFNKKIAALVVLIVIILLSACSKKTQAEMIVGLWERMDEAGNYKTYEFANQEEFIEDFAHYGKYKFDSEGRITLYWGITEAEQSVHKVLIISDVTKNKLTLDNNGQQEIYTRVSQVANLNKKIVGIWEWADGTTMEFTQDGAFLHSKRIDKGFYKVLSNNTVLIFADESYYDLSSILVFTESTNTSLVTLTDSMGNYTDNQPETLKKIR